MLFCLLIKYVSFPYPWHVHVYLGATDPNDILGKGRSGGAELAEDDMQAC